MDGGHVAVDGKFRVSSKEFNYFHSIHFRDDPWNIKD